MKPDNLYTLTEIARMLNIPESTARNYRDQFKQYLAAYATNRKPLYDQTTIDKLRFIASRKQEGKTKEQIHNLLEQQFPKVVEVATSTASLAQEEKETKKQELATCDNSEELNRKVMFAIEAISNYKTDISEIKETLRLIASDRETINRQGEEIEQLKAEIARLKRSWWRRLFSRE